MHDLHLPEIPQKVPVEVHIELAVVVKGQSQLVLLVLTDFPPLAVPENISLKIFENVSLIIIFLIIHLFN